MVGWPNVKFAAVDEKEGVQTLERIGQKKTALSKYFPFNMVDNPYFQFPLCALAFGENEVERLNAIIDYCLVEKGWKLLGKLTAEQQRQFFTEMQRARKLPKGFDNDQWTHRAALYGGNVMNVTLGGFLRGILRYDALDKYIVAFANAHGRDAVVRMKTSWLFKARDGHGLTYREFAVLCGIYSAIGDKQLAVVTRERIRRCAVGYRTAAIMRAELPKRADKGQPLTERQLRDTIERLHRNRFFARATVFRRITYYSIRLDDEALRKKIMERRTYPDFFRASQAAQDKLLTDAIKQKQRESAKREERVPPTLRFHFTPPPERS
jgi:hypothetical protein